MNLSPEMTLPYPRHTTVFSSAVLQMYNLYPTNNLGFTIGSLSLPDIAHPQQPFYKVYFMTQLKFLKRILFRDIARLRP